MIYLFHPLNCRKKLDLLMIVRMIISSSISSINWRFIMILSQSVCVLMMCHRFFSDVVLCLFHRRMNSPSTRKWHCSWPASRLRWLWVIHRTERQSSMPMCNFTSHSALPKPKSRQSGWVSDHELESLLESLTYVYLPSFTSVLMLKWYGIYFIYSTWLKKSSPE